MLLRNLFYGRIAGWLGLCCLAVMLGGCKKLVEVDQPRNTVSTTVLFQTDDQAATAMAGLYSLMMMNTGSLRYSNGGSMVYGAMLADEMVSYAGVSNALDYQFETNTLLYDNTTVDGIFWQPAYKDIFNANSIIEGAEASTTGILSDSARRELIAESKFVRAFGYFNLVNFFGDVPMPLETNFNHTVLMKRAAAADVYKQIVQDLLDAQANLPADYSVAAGVRIRPNKFAATALLARVYLYLGRWKDAEDQATAVIGNSQFVLATDLSKVFNKDSKEAIWQLQPNITVTPFWLFEPAQVSPTLLWPSLGAADQAVFIDSATWVTYGYFFVAPHYMSKDLAGSFEPNDKRRTVWTTWANTPSTAPYYGDTIRMEMKYLTSVAANSVLSQYETKLRLGEQYLIRAEAAAQLGDAGTAAADLNAIRNRAGLPNTGAASPEDLLAAIAKERRVELFGEDAHRWFDLKRTGKATEVLGSLLTKQPWKDYQLLLPIPPGEINVDPNLTQNAGY